jgi:catechol 2,3-dioxygenase-like lactoylglutathione lyase family enzyme
MENPARTDLFFGLSHVDVPVTDLARAERIYHEATGFPIKTRGPGWFEVDASVVLVRLVQTRNPEHTVALRLQSPAVADAVDALVKAGATLLYRASRTPDQELLGAVRDPDGNVLYVWRPLSEDEYDFVPDLPKVLSWAPDAEDFLKSLLKSVPALFRALARHRVVAVAEELAESRRLVTREEVIRGFILASPRVTRGRNRQPLIDHGIDVERYRADWDAD